MKNLQFRNGQILFSSQATSRKRTTSKRQTTRRQSKRSNSSSILSTIVSLVMALGLLLLGVKVLASGITFFSPLLIPIVFVGTIVLLNKAGNSGKK